jgi:hypothetical protein
MSAADSTLLTINAGSSSIKFALFRVGRSLVCRLRGSIEWSDDGRASLTSRFELDGPGPEPPPDFERDDAPPVLLRWLEEREGLGSLAAIGHRVVYGRQRQGPEPVTPLLIDELRQFAPDDPEHLPRERMRAGLAELAPEYSARLGGMTSNNVTRSGVDEAYGLRKLRDIPGIALGELRFLIDALLPGGNDDPVQQVGVPSTRVRDPEQSQSVIRILLGRDVGTPEIHEVGP